ncbi:DUF305 domain-containing protein [Mesorhizobium sp. LHD-90]|uniref:DUF305 domain-containing protein n=1 Tax=Mesorhizobium sp. LHD-90 TaxID=3071414 RepID=UPI0027E00932|nr:DUF305 domain-containing protein [Mesorhizobium sp. LHD-90]MDQ6436454.1 DUF305 domain-containing protein [Mesorhizobium sp. LHD-90]
MTGRHNYLRLLVMAVLSFVAMYVLMYAMVDRLDDVYPNLNQFYMAALMVCPMVVIELIVMRAMYSSRSANIAIAAANILVFGASWAMIRQQTAIGDVQFLKSMISHHSGAILMCREAAVGDPEIQDLCNGIVPGQQSEIDRMKIILKRLERGQDG